jgi:hypothetical protein
MSHISCRFAGLPDQQQLGIQQSVCACPLQVGSVIVDQFEDGVIYMMISTVYLLINLARAKNSKQEIQGHIDG